MDYSKEKELYFVFCLVLNKVYNDIYKKLKTATEGRREIYAILARVTYIRSLSNIDFCNPEDFLHYN